VEARAVRRARRTDAGARRAACTGDALPVGERGRGAPPSRDREEGLLRASRERRLAARVPRLRAVRDRRAPCLDARARFAVAISRRELTSSPGAHTKRTNLHIARSRR